MNWAVMALIWLWSKPIFAALLPFSVYSTFHFLTYLRTNIIPTVFPPPASSAPGAPKSQSAFSEKIATFVKNNYDYSMHLVANLELFLWARIFLGTLVFSNSLILLCIYTVFIRARYAQSAFVRDAFKGLELRGDALSADNNVPDGLKSGWSAVKGAVKSFGELTDVGKYLGASTNGSAQKKSL
jgi:hypothetical protein